MTQREIKAKIKELNEEYFALENETRIAVERFVHETCGAEFYVPYFYLGGSFAVRHADQELNAFDARIDRLSFNGNDSKLKVSMAGKGEFEPGKGLNIEKEYIAFGEFIKNVCQIKDLLVNAAKKYDEFYKQHDELKSQLFTRPGYTNFDGEKTEWIYVDGCGGIELELTKDIMEYCYHSGSCDTDVATMLDIPGIRKQFDKIRDEVLIASLRECGIDEYDPTTATRRENEQWALWMACGNAADEGIFD